MMIHKRIAMFDSDCLEVASESSLRPRGLPDFGIRARMQPMTEQVETLYAFAREHDLTMVFTQCCSANPVKPGMFPEVLVVPMDPSDQAWTEEVHRYRLINIQKHNHALRPQDERPLHESFICRHFDAFQHNSNARRLVELLDVSQWIVFGHGFDLCVDCSIKGILAAGYPVHLLTDVIASSAAGYGPYGTEDSKRAILAYLEKIGVTTGTLEAFLGRFAP